MPKYPLSQSGQGKLNTCHPDLILIVNTGTNYQDITVCDGHRKKGPQDKAYRDGVSQVQWPNSYHNKTPSMAVDVAPYSIEIKNIDWNDIPAFALLIGKLLLIGEQLLEQGLVTHKLVSGFDWDSDGRTTDHGFIDAPHLQLVPVEE